MFSAKWIAVSLSCLIAGALPAAGLLSNGGFEEEKGDWGYATPGKTERVSDARSGTFAMCLTGGGKGSVTQLFSRPLPLAVQASEPCRIKVSFFHKGDGLLFHVRLHEERDGKTVEVKNELGKAVSATFSVPAASDWSMFQREITFPAQFLANRPAVQLLFQRWGSEGASQARIDDVTLEIVAGAPAQPATAATPAATATAAAPKLVIEPPPAGNNGAKPMPKPGFEFGIKDGYLTRDGKPFWYAGNYTVGGGQWRINTLWLHRLLNYSMATLDWGMNFSVQKEKNGDYRVRYRDSESAASVLREMTRQNIIVEFDGGNYMPLYNPLRYQKGLPGLERYFVSGSHFYSFDHNTEEGRQMHYNDWASRFRFLKNMPLMAFECWNELGYTPTHERVTREFRDYARRKYGTLAEANKVWRRNFPSWEEVLPPHLSPEILPGTQAHQFRMEMREKYFEQYYDWLDFLAHDFLPGFRKMKEQFRTFSDAPWSVDTRAHRHYADGYGVMDIELLDDVIDIILLHTWFDSYDYRGEAADSPSVLRSATNALLFHNYFRTNSDKPIINPEDIVSTVGTPGSSLTAMKRNCLGQFPAEWNFTLEPDDSGIAKGYFQPGFDDSGWGRMAVPGCWDETDAWRGRRGLGWYRANFTVPGSYRADYADGSRKFYLYGKGVAQKGTVWINGIKAGEPEGWNSNYRYDIGSSLNFGGENQITFLVDGSNYSNGLRFFVHILPHDRISETRPTGKSEYASRLWSYLMQGNSAVTLWNWEDIWRPFMPELITEINSVAGIAMPAARERYGREIGILMPYRYFRGLPVAVDGYYLDYMNVFGSLVFRQLPVAVLGEKKISEATPEQFPVLFYPYARIVRPETFSHMKRYVEAGGRAVVTFDSLRLEFDRYRDTGIEAFSGVKIKGDYTGPASFTLGSASYPLVRGDIAEKAGVAVELAGADALASYADGTPAVTEVRRGKGKVLFVAANPDFAGTYAITGLALNGIKIEPTIRLTDPGDTREFPWLEGKITGNPDRFLVYLHNWGGIDREVRFQLPEKFNRKSYRVRNVRDPHAAPRTVSGREHTIAVKSCEPAALLFEAPETGPLPLPGVAPERQALLEKIDSWDRNPPSLESPAKKALFLSAISRGGRIGKLSYPQLTHLLNTAGVECWEFPIDEITPELLKKFSFVFLGEDHIDTVRPLEKSGHPLYDMLIDYVRDGGGLLSVGTSARGSSSNGRQRINTVFGEKLGFRLGTYARNPASCGYDDAMQIKATGFADHPVTRNLNAVQFFTLPVFLPTAKCELQPLVNTAKEDLAAPEKPVLLGGALGKGKAVFVSDALWLQPLRVEAEDNIRLLANLVTYLTGEKLPEEREKLLLFTEAQIRAMERWEGR